MYKNNKNNISLHFSRSGGSGQHSANRIVVNVKDAAGAKSGSNNCVVLQDGRASNISIVSTESSDLGSPNSPVEDGLFEPPPDIPAKIRLRSGGSGSSYDPQHFVREADYHQQQRSRGGEHHDVIDGEEEEEEEENSFLENDEDEIEEDVDGEPISGVVLGNGNGLAGYFTSSLESSTPSRRGRPPVIRAAERHRRQLVRDHYEGEDDFDHFEGEEVDEGDDFHISEVPHGGGQVYDEMYEEDELVDDVYDPQVNYDVR